MRPTLILVATMFFFVGSPSVAKKPFDPGCRVLFHAIQQVGAFDRACNDPEGKPRNDRHAAQNRQKNNFCAHRENGAQISPVDLTEEDFVALMERVREEEIPYADAGLPDRDDLVNIYSVHGVQVGEGDFVRFVAFISDARYAPKDKEDAKGKESVNCYRTTKSDHWRNKDIHLELTTRENPREKTAEGCRARITSEISPHLRPSRWNEYVLDLVQDNGNPLRVSGNLFFDASHGACPETKYRLTAWEIHPVYAIDVCEGSSLDDCAIDNDDVWVPLHEWADLPWEDPAED